eukprot:TRINITY_DN71849_c0_g1_i1.p1 TRINITY_DN71849_c0_g1~~TRINITY_DN71849_c0_g1_i1.p1  ORF type:complete len:123 (+),score=14.75 TRINITY_DN71849_c0_g1_i1:43-411(+)
MAPLSADDSTGSTAPSLVSQFFHLAALVDEIPNFIITEFTELSAGLRAQETRRQAVLLIGLVIISFWSALKLTQLLLWTVMRGVMMRSLRDERVFKLVAKRFIATMADMNIDPTLLAALMLA